MFFFISICRYPSDFYTQSTARRGPDQKYSVCAYHVGLDTAAPPAGFFLTVAQSCRGLQPHFCPALPVFVGCVENFSHLNCKFRASLPLTRRGAGVINVPLLQGAYIMRRIDAAANFSFYFFGFTEGVRVFSAA
jgi:hypothetical protein